MRRRAIQGLLHVTLCGLPRTRFRTILSAFANRQSGISMHRAPCVYIMASDRNGTLYTARASGRVSRAAIGASC
ncbi:MAG: hypothetical protein WAL59_26850 [Roseiarcus sp.]